MEIMKIAVFSSKPYDIEYLNKFNQYNFEFKFFETWLKEDTASLTQGFDGVNFVALRCAGFNNIDLEAATKLDIKIARVPKYSPEAVAEYTVGLLLTLSWKYHKAYSRVRENNFHLDGLLGFKIHGKTIGIIGAGAIGLATIKI